MAINRVQESAPGVPRCAAQMKVVTMAHIERLKIGSLGDKPF